MPQLYEHIMRGRCSPAALAQGVSRYRQTAACDPLYAVTARQAEAVSQRLGQLCRAPVPVYIGYKHSPSFVSEAVRQAASDGISRLALLHLSPSAPEPECICTKPRGRQMERTRLSG